MRMIKRMVKEQKLTQMEVSILGDTRMGNIMVKEHQLTLMEGSM